MSYEIPQQLEYQEKIIFGLTFKQLLYAIIFLPLALALLFKLPLSLPYRIALSLIPSGLAILFMFTRIPQHFLNWCKWLFNRSFNQKQIQEYMQIKDIKNDTINLNNSKLSILKVEPLNFSLKNPPEKQILVSSFQKFLNSLDFPIQIIVATDTLNLDHYLTQLEQKSDNNPLYQNIFSDFRQHLNVLIGKLLNRNFYLIIPEKENLIIQTGVCEELLKNMNLRFTRLKDQELLFCLRSFFYDIYTEEPPREGNYLQNMICPKTFLNNPKEVIINGMFFRTITVKGYPRTVEEGFLDKIITINGDFDIALHIEPYDIEQQMVMLNRELQKQRGDLWAMQNKGIINPSLEIKFNDTKMVLENLQKGNEKLFNISLYITCKANIKEDLDLLTKKIESELNALLMVPSLPMYVQHKALKSVLPLGKDELQVKRNLTTHALSAFFPFTSQFLQVDESGILFGLNKNNIPIIKDIFKLYNANGVVLASSGGGKSYFTKLMISRLLLSGTKVMVIDPQGEYIELVHKFGGQLITISKGSETIINPLDLMGHDFDEKKLTLLDLFPVMLGQTSEIQKAVLDRALTSVYEAKGITNDRSSWRKEPPVMGDLLKELVSMSKEATVIEKETYRSLINRIEMYVSGVFGFLNKQTNLNFNNKFVCFNIGEMPNQVKPAVMFLILDYVYMKMKKDIERKILVVDEAWSLLERTEDEGYIFKIVKTCRKFNLGLLLITQDVGDLLRNDAGKALLNNSEYTLLLRQKPSIIELVEKTFQLSLKEREKLLTAQTGEGIIIISNEHSEIKIIASPEEHAIITTNADERLKQEREKANEIITEFETGLDYSKGYFKKASLKASEVENLLKQGYVLSAHIGLFGGRQEEYLLKPRYNEGAEHFFVVKAIEEYIKQFTPAVELFVSSNADIVFEWDGKKIAIEVETGLRAESRVEEKVKLLNQRFAEWFFVVTDWTLKPKYQNLKETFVRKEVPAILKKRYFCLGSNFAGTGSKTTNNRTFEVQNPCLLSDNLSETKTEVDPNGTEERIREQADSGDSVKPEQG